VRPADLGYKQRGRWFAHCGRSPSAWTYPDGGWACGECGKRGDMIDLIREATGCSYLEAKERAGMPCKPLTVPEPMLAPSEAAKALARQIWRFTGPPTGEPEGYLRRRGLWGASRWVRGVLPRQLYDLRRMCDSPEGKEIGLRDWLPWRTGKAGILVPMIHPLGGGTFRWRYCEPLSGRIKAISPNSKSIARWSTAYRPGQGVVIIAEGEPDWMAWCQWTTATVIGLSGGAWRDAWLPPGPEPVLMCTHENHGAARLEEKIRAAAQGRHVEIRRVPESEDWADRAAKGWRP
jgi:hypothetical protein